METGRIYPTGLQQAYAATVRPPLHAYPGTTTPRKNGSYSRLSEDYFPSARKRGEAHPPRPEGHRDIGLGMSFIGAFSVEGQRGPAIPDMLPFFHTRPLLIVYSNVKSSFKATITGQCI